jgi:hypothetical protein
MHALFGPERAEDLRWRLPHLKGIARERAILGEIADAFEERGGKFFLSFRFWKETERRISHHLLFVSKHFRGYHIMKEIIAKESSSASRACPPSSTIPGITYCGLLSLSSPWMSSRLNFLTTSPAARSP